MNKELENQNDLEIMNAILDIRRGAEALSHYSEKYVSRASDLETWYEIQDEIHELNSFIDFVLIEAEHREEREREW